MTVAVSPEGSMTNLQADIGRKVGTPLAIAPTVARPDPSQRLASHPVNPSARSYSPQKPASGIHAGHGSFLLNGGSQLKDHNVTGKVD